MGSADSYLGSQQTGTWLPLSSHSASSTAAIHRSAVSFLVPFTKSVARGKLIVFGVVCQSEKSEYRPVHLAIGCQHLSKAPLVAPQRGASRFSASPFNKGLQRTIFPLVPRSKIAAEPGVKCPFPYSQTCVVNQRGQSLSMEKALANSLESSALSHVQKFLLPNLMAVVNSLSAR